MKIGLTDTMIITGLTGTVTNHGHGHALSDFTDTSRSTDTFFLFFADTVTLFITEEPMKPNFLTKT